MGISPQSMLSYTISIFRPSIYTDSAWIGCRDVEIVQKAQEEGYVIWTHDLDFGELLVLSGDNTLVSIIYGVEEHATS